MGLPSKYLGQGEVEILHLRTHAKVLVRPTFMLLLVAVCLGVVIAITPVSWQWWAFWAQWGLAIILIFSFSLYPFMRWYTTTYTLTNRRIITRRGIIKKIGHDLPLGRVNNVAYEKGLIDRMFGCGTLVLTTAAEAPVKLEDIPDIERVHVLMTELLFGEHPQTDPETLSLQNTSDE
ncbi:MAG: PH domain-containing protein [Propionibacteriaceae bacterium]|nr:PH domain-containing protein [Propionibacteriaceae bacterium]